FAFGQLGELGEQLRIAGVFGGELLQLLASGGQVARGMMCLSQAERELAALIGGAAAAIEAIDEAVEAVGLDVQLSKLHDDIELVVEIARFFERLPIDFDRFV